jgi:ABC-2 type transport system permease protein
VDDVPFHAAPAYFPRGNLLSVSRYWRIYRSFFVSSFARELEFRANFIAKVAQNVVWVFFFIMILLVVYRNTATVAGWSRGDAFVLAATCFLMTSMLSAFFLSLQEIPQQVRQGTLDFVITKPIDTQFWVSSRKFNFDQIGTLTAGFVMVFYGVRTAGLHPAFLDWIGYIALTVSSLALFYSFYLILMTLGIWLVRVDNLWVLGESVVQVARYPLDIYNVPIQRFFTFVLPLAFISTIPSRQLVNGFSATMVALGLFWGFVAVAVSRWFWNFALKHYSSASS